MTATPRLGCAQLSLIHSSAGRNVDFVPHTGASTTKARQEVETFKNVFLGRQCLHISLYICTAQTMHITYICDYDQQNCYVLPNKNFQLGGIRTRIFCSSFNLVGFEPGSSVPLANGYGEKNRYVLFREPLWFSSWMKRKLTRMKRSGVTPQPGQFYF
jgi:hypothetical protein